MSWETQRIEKVLRALLKDRFSEARADEIYSMYVTARSNLVEDVLPEIKAKEPFLTEHGPLHIRNVLDNVYRLVYGSTPVNEAISIAKKAGSDRKLTAVELYSLCLCVLFHDVGNVFGREGHEERIPEVYRHVRSSNPGALKERTLVVRVAGAHTGTSLSGDHDTLKPLSEISGMSLFGDTVRPAEIGAILRFADELEEGTDRTSQFMRAIDVYPEESEIFHTYASITSIQIDRGNGRIAVSYEIDLTTDEEDDGSRSPIPISELRELLEFTAARITKLNSERQYTKYYSQNLDRFRLVSIKFNVWVDDRLLNLDNEPITVSDKVVPTTNNIDNATAPFDVDELYCRIDRQVAEVKDG